MFSIVMEDEMNATGPMPALRIEAEYDCSEWKALTWNFPASSDALLHRPDASQQSCSSADLGVDLCHMEFDCFFADAHLGSDCFVRVSGKEEL
jgi:hypothetical protein